MILKNMLLLYRAAADKWNADKAPRLAAALAYYATFSLAPLALVTIWIAGLIFGNVAAREHLIAQITTTFGPDSAALVQSTIDGVYRNSSSWPVSLIAIGALLFGATGLFFSIQDSLNTVWNVPPKPPRSLWRSLLGIFQDRALSFLMVLASGGLLTLSLATSALLTALDPLMRMMQPNSANLLNAVNLAASFLVVALLFALVYRIMPETRVTWRDVWLGALSAALLFTIGKFAMGIYLTYSNLRSVFGAASSFVVVLIWIYYSAQIFLFGAEVGRAYTGGHGSVTE